MKLYLPENYKAKLGSYDTQKAISMIHIIFEKKLCEVLNLCRVSAPLVLEKSTGLNDDLNGIERPVEFDIKEDGRLCQVVQSLAKWKRKALRDYGFSTGYGLYTDMNAIRRDEELDNIHSIYVDQWDWEKIIDEEDRNIEYLYDSVRKIVAAICDTEDVLRGEFPALNELSKKNREVFFIDSQKLEDMYPSLSAKEREYAIVKEHHTCFISKIGDKLSSGLPHDNRAPDYDDWQLNGDLLFWDETLNMPLEISSMGIRVSKESLDRQLKLSGHEERKNFDFHKELLLGNLPQTIGGGIGQSRLCMLLLGSAHIGEVQSSIWNDEIKIKCKDAGIRIL